MLLEILWAATSTFAFGIIFNLKGKKLFCASAGGALGWIIYIFFKYNGSSIPASFLYSSIAITIYSEIIARFLKTPVTSTLIASLIPLVPGSGVYFTMSYLVENKIEDAVAKGTETLLITAAITVGIVLVSTFSQIYYKIRRYNKIKKKIDFRNSIKLKKQINKF
ncbi:threonine/serine exporter family protein [Fusobacterium sp.]|uniref:threonine/serine exporter family protein n=1 Tax=Fusobacterium sp. TaxID=68766 RepID=UPI0029042CCB|nr:threonine/serine exporter family protein [Fusobacterium sp.]MDU1911174.1 threonine/serine exporter family protein [Fusobacterium sp.]